MIYKNKNKKFIMIGFYLQDEKCNVLPELSLYDKTHDLYELINNIPYSQATCCFCLNDFFNNINLKTECSDLNTKDLNTKDLNTKDLNTKDLNTKDLNTKDLSKFVLNTEGLNMDWFKSRIVVLNCNHIFHVCCFIKYIKNNYTEYIFSNVNINNININDNIELDPNISRSLSDKSVLSDLSNSKSEYSILKNDSDINEILFNMEECLHKNINNTNSTVDSIESYNQMSSNKNLSEESYNYGLSNIKIYYEYLNNLINESKDESNKSEIRSFYESEISNNTDISICFKIGCPLCKKKVNNISISSILEKYKLLLELYT